MKKILITGGCGYLAGNLFSALKKQGYKLALSSRQSNNDSQYYHYVPDDSQSYLQIIKNFNPDIVIHTAWINSLNQCEENESLSEFANLTSSKSLIESISQYNPEIKLIFISSDYVFEGNNGQYKEESECKPITVYGKHKVQVEEAIVARLKNYLIIRTANVYDLKSNFFNFIYSNLIEHNTIDVFYDTFFTPTYLGYFIDSFLHLLQKDITGVIHIAGSERISRYQFAFQLASVLHIEEKLIIPTKAPDKSLIASDVSLNSEYSRRLLSNYTPTIEKSFNFLLKRLIYPYFSYYDQRGGMLGITQNQSWEEINYVEAVQWAIRGGHYHKETLEGFFIIEGRIRVETQKLNSKRYNQFFVEKGDIFFIEPNTIHTFYVLENSKWINFLDKSMKLNHEDLHRP
ncbi:MAG: sugar nucleotide-binding protein [Gammaproteobacteria bacterium]|nr:sugar nucleotide-binding protein [Gammaproteobacteria bacterium]